MNIATRQTTLPVAVTRSAWATTWAERVGWLIVVTTCVRFVIAATTGLSDTEAYYAQWARFPDLSYYDHPPLIAWTTWLIGRVTHDRWTVRLGPVFYGAVLSALLYRLGARLFSPRAGFFAVAILTALPAIAFTGFLLNPEALLAPLWILALLLLHDMRDKDEPWRPLVLGAVIGVAFLAKYTAILAVPVTVLYLAGSSSTRRWLRRPSFYLAGVIALALAAPVVVWNHLHDWPSVRLHLSERMVQAHGETVGGAMRRVASGQMALFHPLILPSLLAALIFAVHRSRSDERYRLLATASLPVLAFLLFVMGRAGDSEPHWTLVGYMPLVVAAGGILDETTGRLRRSAELMLRASLLVSAAVAAVYVWHLRSPVWINAIPSYNPNADPYVETVGWDRVGEAVRTQLAHLGPHAVAAGAHNVVCGHLESELDDIPRVYCPSRRRTEYDFRARRSPPAEAPVVFINSDRYPDDPVSALPEHRCAPVQDVDIARGGRLLASYHVFDCLPRAGSEP